MMNMNTEYENTMTAGPSPPPKTKRDFRIRCPECGSDHIVVQWRCTRIASVRLDVDGSNNRPYLYTGSVDDEEDYTRDVFRCFDCDKKSYSSRVFIDVALPEVDA